MKDRAKRLRGCSCTPQSQPGHDRDVAVACHWGNCTEWRCASCNGLLGSAGAIWCPCDGYIRWLRHPGMRNWTGAHAAIKPSKARRSQAGAHDRKRR